MEFKKAYTQQGVIKRSNKYQIKKHYTDMTSHEKAIIQQAIARHSEKDKIDDAYSEILKDADVLAQYFAETDIVLSDEGQKRLKKYLPEKI